MKKRNLLVVMLSFSMVMAAITGCGKATGQTNKEAVTEASDNDTVKSGEGESAEASADEENADDSVDSSNNLTENGEITIVYTNDVHSYIDNVVKDSEGNVSGDGLRFSKIAAMVSDMRNAGKNVLLVDAGDEIQGNIYGAMDEGATIISIMKETGYQLATPGNHDFDYGVISFLKLVEVAGFPYVSCNFHSTNTREVLFPDRMIFDIAGKKVAFVGISTPETITSSTPVYFQDEKGEFIYTVEGMYDPQDLYSSVQNAVNNAREEADYVIALGHVGVGLDEKKEGISSEDIIANVSGLDAFIDGHSHSTIEGNAVKDKDGKDVILTQTGSYLGAVGVMTISEDGKISTELVEDYEREDDKVAKLEKDWIDDITNQMGEQIAVLDTKLYVNNPDNEGERWIRAKELNIGDFTADSIYWFFNERLDLQCDVTFQNGGGIRADIPAGEVTYMNAKQVDPFGNMICLIAATGQQILDALEMGVTVAGEWDYDWNKPAENGGFLHVAGLSYTVDASIPSSVKTDDKGMFESVDGAYRVKDVKIYNRKTGKYESMELDQEYYVGGINYVLRNSGNGLSMFADDTLQVDYVGQDYVILAEYMKSFTAEDGMSRINTKNCPLASYEGYLLDYDNPLGSGRIEILNADYPD